MTLNDKFKTVSPSNVSRNNTDLRTHTTHETKTSSQSLQTMEVLSKPANTGVASPMKDNATRHFFTKKIE